MYTCIAKPPIKDTPKEDNLQVTKDNLGGYCVWSVHRRELLKRTTTLQRTKGWVDPEHVHYSEVPLYIYIHIYIHTYRGTSKMLV